MPAERPLQQGARFRKMCLCYLGRRGWAGGGLSASWRVVPSFTSINTKSECNKINIKRKRFHALYFDTEMLNKI